MITKFKNLSPTLKIYFIILPFSALGLGLSNGVISNYFKEAYNVTAYQRGLIEFPRELPGVLTLFLIAALSSFSDIRIALIAQALGVIGIITLGLFTPTFSIMLVFIFINSLGMHMSMPLRDSIGLDIVDNKNLGKVMGEYKGVFTGFSMISSLIVFIGFRYEIFSFTTKIKWIFILSGLILLIVFVLYIVLEKTMSHKIKSNKKIKFVFRKEYKYFYVLTTMFGVQKQIMIVYGPWVLIEILNKRADTLAILGILGSLVGIFFIPALGRWIGEFGIKKILYFDALSFILVYLIYGILVTGFVTNMIPLAGIPVLIAYLLFIFDKMSNQMGMVRTLYLKSILVENEDMTPTLSLGLSLDHVVSIICAYLGGLVWIKFGPQYIFFGSNYVAY
ncbi:MAG: MFS transporter [Bacillota bacterium]|nr:MFS transporter [Bacillota bacterium]